MARNRIVYHGPGLSGCFSNLEALQRIVPAAVVEPLDLEQGLGLNSDRIDGAPGLGTLQLETTPASLVVDPRRTAIIQQADAFVLVFDSQAERAQANLECFEMWRATLLEVARDPQVVPTVAQVTKLDTSTAEPFPAVIANLGVPSLQAFPANPPRNEGVLQTFLALLQIMFARLSA